MIILLVRTSLRIGSTLEKKAQGRHCQIHTDSFVLLAPYLNGTTILFSSIASQKFGHGDNM